MVKGHGAPQRWVMALAIFAVCCVAGWALAQPVLVVLRTMQARAARVQRAKAMWAGCPAATKVVLRSIK